MADAIAGISFLLVAGKSFLLEDLNGRSANPVAVTQHNPQDIFREE